MKRIYTCDGECCGVKLKDCPARCPRLTLTELPEATASPPVSPSKSSELLKRKDALNDSFRMIISHWMMGYECKMEREDFDGMLSDLVDSAVAL